MEFIISFRWEDKSLMIYPPKEFVSNYININNWSCSSYSGNSSKFKLKTARAIYNVFKVSPFKNILADLKIECHL